MLEHIVFQLTLSDGAAGRITEKEDGVGGLLIAHRDAAYRDIMHVETADLDA